MEHLGQLLQREQVVVLFETENTEEYLHFILKVEFWRDLDDLGLLHWRSAQD